MIHPEVLMASWGMCVTLKYRVVDSQRPQVCQWNSAADRKYFLQISPGKPLWDTFPVHPQKATCEQEQGTLGIWQSLCFHFPFSYYVFIKYLYSIFIFCIHIVCQSANTHEGQRHQILPGLEIQEVLRNLTWVLRIKLWSYVRTVRSFKFWVISTACFN